MRVPKSRGRRPKPGSRSRPRPPDRSRDQYRPGVVKVDDREGFAFVAGLAPSQLLPLGLPVWRLLLTPGSPANQCLDGSLVLREAFDMFGVRAEPKVVTLTVHDRQTGAATRYGSGEPRFAGGHFKGHMGLWLPESGRFIDHSVQQFPQVRREGWHPVIAKQPAGLIWGAASFGVPRGGLMLEYVTAPDERTAAVLDHAVVRDAAVDHHRAGMNLASNFLDLLRSDELLDRTLAAPHPRLHALVRALAGATSHIDEEQNYRFTLPGTDTAVYLDDIALTAQPPRHPTASRAVTTAPTTAPITAPITAPAADPEEAPAGPQRRRWWRRLWPGG